MTPITYLDFDLAIDTLDPTTGRYRVRVLNAPAGQATGEFVLPFTPIELENYILKMGRTRRGRRSLGSPEGQAALTLGSRLYDTLFTGAVQASLLRSLDQAQAQGSGLRLRLRLLAAPDLLELPWEFLYDTTYKRFLVHSTATPLVRYLELPRTAPPLTVTPPLQLLVMIANPHDLGALTLDVEAEWAKVQQALAPLVEKGLIQVTRLENGSLSALQRRLRRGQYHIFHYIGHAGFDRATGQGVLLLEDEGGRSRQVASHTLGTLLHDHQTLRLALLNACEGARTAASDPFAGIAQQLVQQGIPAVIAMQFEITDEAAIIFAHEFYDALADGYGVDAALAEARKAIYAAGNDVEWGTPVLYMRSSDGNLFALSAARAEQTPLKHESKSSETQLGEAVANPKNSTGAPDKDLAAKRRIATHPTKSYWNRPGLLLSFLAVVLLLGMGWLWPQVRAFFAQVNAEQPPTPTVASAFVPVVETPTTGGVTATMTATLGSMVTPTLAPQPTPTNTPDAAATALALAAQTAEAATRATDQAATRAAATLAAIPTATSTAPPTVTPTVPPTATPRPTHTATPQPTPTPTLGIGSTMVITIAANVTATLLYVPAGEFLMGSTDAQIDDAVKLCNQYYGDGDDCQRDWYTDEAPQHPVTVDAFWLMQTEVTNAQYRVFVDAGGYSEQQWWSEAGWQWRTSYTVTVPSLLNNSDYNQANYPVVGISWYEAMAYAAWLTNETGLEVRLPTEAEWEKAARGIAGLIFPWGNTWDGSRVNYCDQNCTYDWKDETVDDGYALTAPVGSYPTGVSPYGLLDMAGNVWEWTSSLDQAYPYDRADGREAPTGSGRRVVRGGSWGYNPFNVRAAHRFRYNPDNRGYGMGVRMVVVAPR